MLSLSSEDYFLEEADSNIQANLEDADVQKALKSGVDLREYSKQVEDELREVENESIRDYINEAGNIAALHNQIVGCDKLLENMENMLLSFRADLGSISSEIQSLQQQSVQMNIKLRNRQAIRGELTQFVDEMAVPEEMIMTIMDSPVQEPAFLENLQNLEHKINFLKEQSFHDARSCLDVKDIVDKLKIRAICKIREFLLEKINLFKKPMTNYHIPQNTILKFRFYFKFLVANNRDVAKEIKDYYVDTMSKVLFSYFKSYSGRLAKLQYDEPTSENDLMGVDDTQPKSFFRSHSTSHKPPKASVFSMGTRGDVVTTELESPILVPHAFEKSGTKCPYEKLFRSEQYCLMENACREYLFLAEFFMVQGNAAQDLFTQVFGKTLHLLSKGVGQYVQESYDSIALFLCVHLVSRFKDLCHQKDVLALDKYWDTIHGLLWPRLQIVIKLNVQSVKDCDPQKFKITDLRPHYVTRRYAEFSTAFISINEKFPDVNLNAMLLDMEQEIGNFVMKMASSFPQRKEQLIFVINNYDIILSIMAEKTTGESQEADFFRVQFSARTSEYVEEILQPHFGDLIRFVKEAESEKRLDSKNSGDYIGRIIISFNSKWKNSLDGINKEVLNSFPNFKNGTEILQMALTQFVQYYHRFHKIVSGMNVVTCPNRDQLINIHQLMVEVKKYKPSF